MKQHWKLGENGVNWAGRSTIKPCHQFGSSIVLCFGTNTCLGLAGHPGPCPKAWLCPAHREHPALGFGRTKPLLALLWGVSAQEGVSWLCRDTITLQSCLSKPTTRISSQFRVSKQQTAAVRTFTSTSEHSSSSEEGSVCPCINTFHPQTVSEQLFPLCPVSRFLPLLGFRMQSSVFLL